MDHLQVHFVAHKFSDVVNAILDHGGPTHIHSKKFMDQEHVNLCMYIK